MSSNLAEKLSITPEEYLQGEELADEKHEYYYGEVYAMAGAKASHVLITGNIQYALKTYLRGSECQIYTSDMQVRINEDDAYFYPDVMVTCDKEDRKRETMKQSPVLIIEVLSAGTEAYDRGKKFAAYRELQSLREYVLIDPYKFHIDIFRLNSHGRWELFSFSGADATVEFASIGLQCPMLEIYEDINFS
jgi:Uma2 family endonuclease